MKRISCWMALVALALRAGTAWCEPARVDEALEFLRPPMGERQTDFVREGDTLLDIALRNRLGFDAIARLNPEVDSWLPSPGLIIRLPTEVILPSVVAEGLVINVPEMRLFDFTVSGGPQIFAAAVGDVEDPTPVGDFQIRDKRIDPVWNVPASIRAEKPELPSEVPAGPDNPLGSRWLRIGYTSYGIHGTNNRWSIGREATHGCVRLYEQEVLRLFERTPEGTRLQIVYQPYKWGRRGSEILLEAHPDRYGLTPDRLATALGPLRPLGLLDHVDIGKVWDAVDESRGIPVVVGELPF